MDKLTSFLNKDVFETTEEEEKLDKKHWALHSKVICRIEYFYGVQKNDKPKIE